MCKISYELQYTPVLMSLKGKIFMNYRKASVIFSVTIFPIHTLQCTGAGKQWLVIMVKHMLTEVKCWLKISYSVSHSSLLSHFSITGKDEGLILMCLQLKICVWKNSTWWIKCNLDCLYLDNQEYAVSLCDMPKDRLSEIDILVSKVCYLAILLTHCVCVF